MARGFAEKVGSMGLTALHIVLIKMMTLMGITLVQRMGPEYAKRTGTTYQTAPLSALQEMILMDTTSALKMARVFVTGIGTICPTALDIVRRKMIQQGITIALRMVRGSAYNTGLLYQTVPRSVNQWMEIWDTTHVNLTALDIA